MATAVGAGFDLSKLLSEFSRLDKELEKFVKKGKDFEKNWQNIFNNMGKGGLQSFASQLASVRKSVVDFGKQKVGVKWDSNSLQKYIDDVNKLILVIKAVQKEAKKENIKGVSIVGLKKELKEANELLTLVKRAEKAFNQSATNRQQTYKGSLRYSSNAKTIEQERQAIINLTAAREKLKKTDSDYANKLNTLNEAIQRHELNLKNVTKTARQQREEYEKRKKSTMDKWYSSNSERAIKFSSNAKTLEDEARAIKYLEAARAKLNTQDKNYERNLATLNSRIREHKKNLDDAKKGSQELRDKHNSLIHTGDQLKRALLGIFSVSAIQGYINKLREVRGEFEMQQRSLQILLQNKDKADELWEKTIDLAVKSPFRVKELVTYTKQLAAYRVESDKLYDTTKMLADVSAGLGVDMNRLILAFGQVKAANFLRGTELRQFTEAGIPMLDELAKLFTELEGRAVSAGDVFERISKRMVTFGDVEEVFNRITSAGGVFYNMQEEQSKTLAGLYSNLHDSIDLMLNDIGKANEGLLKGSMNVAKDFVENWREIADIMKAWGIALSPLIARTILFKAANTGLSTSLVTLFTNTNKGLAISMAYGRWLSKLSRQSQTTAWAVKGLGKAMSGLATIGVSAVIAGTVALITKLYSEMTRASREAKRLEKDLNAIFNEDTSNLERQSDTFKDLVERLKDVNIGSKEHKNIISQLNNQYGEYLGFIVDEKTTYDQLASSINSVTTALTQKAKASSYEKALERMYEGSDKRIAEQSENAEEIFRKGLTRKGSDVKLIPTDSEIEDIFNLIDKKVRETGKTVSDGLDINEILSEYYGETVSVYDSGAKAFINLTKEILSQKVEEEKIQNRINQLYGYGTYSTKAYREEMEALNKAKEEELSGEKSRSGREKIEYKYKVEEVRLQGRYEGLDDSAIQKRVDEIQKVSATVADINRRMSEEAGKFGQDAIDRVYITYQDASQGIDAIAEQTAASYKSMQQEIKDQNALKEAGTVHDQEALDNATLMSKVYYRMLEIMGKTELAKEKGADSKELKRLKEQIKLIRDAAKAYDDMRKLHDKAYADEQIVKEYGPAFKEAKLGDISGYAFGTRQDEQNNLEKLRASAEKTTDGVLELNKAIAQVGVNIADADQEILDKKLFDSISDIFSNYEISLEMDKLNIPKDFARKVFGFDSISLDELRPMILEKFNMSDMVGMINKEIYKSGAFQNMSKERQKELKDSLEKEQKLQDDYLKNTLNKYLEYNKKVLSERAKIKADELNALREIDKTFTDDETKEIAVGAIRDKAQQQMKQLEWDEFRSSDVFVNMFEDLDKASEHLIKASIERIEEFKKTWEDMPVQAAKEMTKRLNELQLALYDSTNVRKDKKLIEEDLDDELERRGLKGKGKSARGQILLSESIQGENQAYTELIEKSNRRIELLQLINNLTSSNKALDLEALGYNQEYIEGLGLEYSIIENIATDNDELIQQEKDSIKKLNEKIVGNQQVLNLITKQKSKAQELAEAWQKMLGMANDLYSSFSDLAEAANWDFSDEMKIFGEMGSSMVDAVMNAIMLQIQLKAVETGAYKVGTAMNTAMGVIGWIVMAIQLVVSALNTISKINQEKRAKQVEAEVKSVELLAKKYEKLEKSIENAYSAAKLMVDSTEAQDNLNAQIDSMERAIAVYESANQNKLSDEEKDDLEQKKEELVKLQEQSEELKETISSIATGGILDDVSSAADGFVDAWLSAFEETGDGMKGLEDEFDEMIKTMIKKQMSLQIVGPVVAQWREALGKYINENDTILTEEDASAWAKEVKSGFGALNANLKTMVGSLQEQGITFGETENALSGLSGGIQGITEEQANILEAYWNQVRGDISSIRVQFEEYISHIKGDNNNGAVKYLKDVADNTLAIKDCLDAIVKDNSQTGSLGLRVYIN